jgi:hypothetical protein
MLASVPVAHAAVDGDCCGQRQLVSGIVSYPPATLKSTRIVTIPRIISRPLGDSQQGFGFGNSKKSDVHEDNDNRFKVLPVRAVDRLFEKLEHVLENLFGEY